MRVSLTFELQIDSWWYFKGPNDGVKNWTAMPSAFPNGIEAVVKKTGLPIVAHNRWWYVHPILEIKHIIDSECCVCIFTTQVSKD